MIKVVSKDSNLNNNERYFGVHDGKFHADEVMAIAILNILYGDDITLNVIRSRDIKYFDDNNILKIDVGLGKFDHHQIGGNGVRENGVKYASCGLIWREFGYDVINKLSNNELSQNDVDRILDEIDSFIVQPIDAFDNGQDFDKTSSGNFRYIPNFNPNWNEDITLADRYFEIAANMASKQLEREIIKRISCRLSDKLVNLNNIGDYIYKNILILDIPSFPWKKVVQMYNRSNNNKIDFVITPYNTGGYILQCVTTGGNNPFELRIKLPADWVVDSSILPIVTGCKSAVFCHKDLFMARVLEKNDAIKMAEIATKRSYSNNNSKKRRRKKN